MSVLAAKKIRPVSLGFTLLDYMFPGFEFGDFAVLHGNAASFVSFVLSVRVQLPFERGGIGSTAVFVDGGNSFDPYLVAETARSCCLDSKAALENVCVSRAFTAYQFSSLILENLHSILRKTRARLLIVSDITSLFLDRDVPRTDAEEFFMKVCSKLSEIASEGRVIVVASYFPARRSRQGLFFETALFGKCNVLAAFKKMGRGRVFSFVLEDHPRIKPFSVGFAADDASLVALMEV
jgi:hypothetical protein